MKAVLISTYELGRQPFGLASPAAWLRDAGIEVTCLDLSQVKLDEKTVREADVIATYLPMHTATRIALNLFPKLIKLNPTAHLCAYGLYAPINESLLKKIGVETILGGEFEQSLLDLITELKLGEHTENKPLVSLTRQKFLVPDRQDLPNLKNYASLIMPDETKRIVGYTEATRGCKHLCRHCPIVPVYKGRFTVVQRDIVLEDVRRQVAQSAQHITFGDPDFFNGIGHSLKIIHAIHSEFPHLTYDVTIKVEHLLKHARHLQALKETGCAFVVSAVEAVDDRILRIFDKGHTRDDFLEIVRLCKEAELVLVPTFVAFTPWTTLEGYKELLKTIAELDLIEHVSPIQLAIRLLIPAGSRLLELSDVQKIIKPFDERLLSYRWTHPDSRVDDLQQRLEQMVQNTSDSGTNRQEIFHQAWRLLLQVMDQPDNLLPEMVPPSICRAKIPYLNEPWYC